MWRQVPRLQKKWKQVRWRSVAFVLRQSRNGRTNEENRGCLLYTSSVTAVIPYFGYAKGDKKDEPRVSIRARVDVYKRQQSRYEAMLVEKACRAWKIPLIVEHLQVNANRMKGESIEMAARRLRYQALEWQREPEEWIVTAHHQNDVAETVLMHAIQGTGLRGLQGIPAKNGRIVRPMLAVSHEEIRCYIDACKIAHCEDQSNADPAYLRNRIRNTLLPLLCRAYNPQVVCALARLAEYAAEEEAYFAPIVENLEKKAKIGEEKMCIRDRVGSAQRILCRHCGHHHLWYYAEKDKDVCG